MPEIFRYDPSDGYLVTVYKGILDRRHTVLPQVMGRGGFWLLFSLHLVVYVLHHADVLKGEDLFSVNWHDVKIITAITTFFIVFYSNQCFQRYVHFYDHTKQLITCVHIFIFEFRLHIRPVGDLVELENYVRLVSRYVLALLLLFFFDERADACDRGTASDSEWQKLLDYGFLKSNEVEFLRNPEHKWSTRQRSLIILHWCAQVTREGFKKVLAKKAVPNNALKCMIDALHHIRRHLADVQDTTLLPVPYPYYHLLSMMLVINLCLWAYCMGLADSIFSPVVFFFAALIFMGLMELASQLSSPFGDDSVDFPLEQWLSDVSRDTFALAEYQFLDTAGWERTLATEKPFDHQGREWISQIVHNFLDPDAPDLNIGNVREGPQYDKKPTRQVSKSICVQDAPGLRGRKAQPRKFMRFLWGPEAEYEEYEEYAASDEADEEKHQKCSLLCAVDSPGAEP